MDCSVEAVLAQNSGGGGLMDMVTGLLDKDKDGSALDDILGMFTRTQQLTE